MHLFLLKKRPHPDHHTAYFPFYLYFLCLIPNRWIVLEKALREARVQNDNNMLNHSCLGAFTLKPGFLEASRFFIQMTKHTKYINFVGCVCIIHISPGLFVNRIQKVNNVRLCLHALYIDMTKYCINVFMWKYFYY